MSAEGAVDLCVIGAGAGGLSVASGAARLGARTVLIECGRMGGDCLNVGCVPSKALLAAAKRAALIRGAGAFGIEAAAPAVDFAAVMRHVRAVIAAIAPQDSQERFEAMGVRVLRRQARFLGPGTVAAGDDVITARRIVIATGARPAIPPIPGLDRVNYLTNETIFDNETLPAHLVVIGGGPLGLELAQAHRLLGARVTVLEADRALAKDDPELAAELLARLRANGIAIAERTRVLRVAPAGAGIAVTVAEAAGEREIVASHLLVAAGRRAALDGLDLDRAGIAIDAHGLVLDRRLRTTNRRIYAVGDAAGGPQFTHVAADHASIVIRNALFRLPAKVDDRALPWVTYTAPELAQVGMTEAQARARHGADIAVLRAPFAENDRAQAEHATQGLVKVVARRNGSVLGASILGESAGELIQLWGLAIAAGIRLSRVARMIAPYPTLGEASKRAAAGFYAPRLFAPRTRRLVRLLARFG